MPAVDKRVIINNIETNPDFEDKPLKSGSYRNRKNTAPENLNNLNGGKIA